MARGRPKGSIIRNRICAILERIGTSYGYEIYKIYKKLFGNIHIRSIYYNLKKGLENEEIILVNVKRELGDFSWGGEVEKVYYTTGPYANSAINKKDMEKLKQIKTKKKFKIDWDEEIKNLYQELKKEIKGLKNKDLHSQTRKKYKEHYLEKIKKLADYAEQKINKKVKEKYESELKKELNI